MNLRSTLDALVSSFASAVLNAIRGASLQDLLAETGGAPRRGPGRPPGSTTKSTPTAGRASAPKRKGRLARRSPEDIAKALGTIVSLLKGKRNGMRSEEIQKALQLDKRELPRVLTEGLKSKKLRSKGQKRGRAYYAA